MRFPNTEPEIRALAQSIIAGLEGNANFPSPPFSAAQLQTLLDTVIQRSDAQVLSQAAAKQDTDSKQASISEMAVALKSVLRYAENAAHGDDTMLAQLGWGGRAASHALQAPGQSRLLEVKLELPALMLFSAWEQKNFKRKRRRAYGRQKSVYADSLSLHILSCLRTSCQLSIFA